MENIKIAMVSKLMPYYRLGVFQKLTALNNGFEFTFFGDTKEQGGIKQIPFKYANTQNDENIRWIKTSNYFYKPERLLWQTGIIKEIFKSDFKFFVFEGAIAHYPIWLFAFLCKIRGKKVLFWTHGNRGLDRGIKKILRKILFKYLGDGLLLYGHYQRNLMINEDGYDPKRLFVIYNSLQPEKQLNLIDSYNNETIQKFKLELFENSDLPILIFIGRLVSHKGVMEILKMMQSLKRQDVLINCIFIGDGPEKSNMIKFCNENHLKSNVYFAGALYDEDEIAPFFAASDMMISPGNVGLNCIHSLAYGVPVLTHDNFVYQNPEVEAIINGKNGLFYTYNNFEDMSIKLKLWINSNHKNIELKKNCQEVINTIYNPENQALCIENAVKMTAKNK